MLDKFIGVSAFTTIVFLLAIPMCLIVIGSIVAMKVFFVLFCLALLSFVGGIFYGIFWKGFE